MTRRQAEDDLAEKLRSNDMLQRAINSYREAAELPDVTSDLLRAALKRRAERQQFLGNTNTDTTAITVRSHRQIQTIQAAIHCGPDLHIKSSFRC